MTATQYYLAEFDLEMGTTRRVLERVPEGKLTWKPHAKSSSLGQLASHVAQMPDWMAEIFKGSEFNFRPADGPAYAAADCKSSAELLEVFDRSVAKARAAVAKAGDDSLDVPWALKAGDMTIFTLPRWQVYRSWGMNHVVHHRGQLTVYLRLLDVAVPSVYGPSADEPK
ncbi:MAG: DinB family protein [Gemmatimonadaceae bacterium]